MVEITTLVNFNLANGLHPVGSLVEDAAGDLFGTAVESSTPGTESVFEIAKTRDGYASAPTILATFDDESFLVSGITIDAGGDLFVQTNGANYNTNVYRIAKSAGGYAAPASLATIGGEPAGSLVIADSGALIGVTAPAFNGGGIDVYQVAQDGSQSTIATIAPAADDYLAEPQLARDAAGDLFVAFSSGPFIAGTVTIDEIAKTPTGYATPQTLASISVGYASLASLLVDAAGNVFAGVSGYQSSEIVEVAKTGASYAASPTYVDSNLPTGLNGSLAEDADGNLFAATAYDAYNGGGAYGEVFKEARSSTGQYSQQLLAHFADPYFSYPSGLLLGRDGELYGTTPGGGADGDGTLFRIDLAPPPTVSITLIWPSAPGVLTLNGRIDVADAALPVSIYDGDDLLGTATPAADGFWTFTAFMTVPSGESDFEAVVTNASGAAGSARGVLFYNTNNNWGVASGANDAVYLENAQASITAGGASVYFDGPGDAVSLYNTSGHWDTVTGDYGVVVLTSSQASIVGGGDAIYFANSSGNAVSLYATFDKWDTATGDNVSLTLVNAQVSVFGGYDTIYFDGSPRNAASLYATNGHWDTVYGDNGSVTLSGAQVSVVGGADSIYFVAGTHNQASLYNTNGVADSVVGSNGVIYLSNAQSAVTGGSNLIYFLGANDAAHLYATSGRWDTVYATGAGVMLHGAQASVFGGGDSIRFDGSSLDAVSLYNTNDVWDTLLGDFGALTLNGAQATVLGQGDYIYFSPGAKSQVSLYSADDHIVGSSGSITLTSAQADVQGDGDTLYFSGASAAAMMGANETFVFAAAFGHATIGGFVASDVIQFSSAEFANWQALSGHIAQSGADVVITYDADDSVTLTHSQASSLTAANFQFV